MAIKLSIFSLFMKTGKVFCGSAHKRLGLTSSTARHLRSSGCDDSSSWRAIDFLAAGLWLTIPIGLLIGRRQLLPVFEDFGIELPTATQYLLHIYSPIPFAVASLGVFLAILSIPHGSMRRRFMWLACIIGGLIGAGCLVSFLVPLCSLWQNLM